MEDNKSPIGSTEKAQVTADVSHGIKNILQAITGGREAVDYGVRKGDLDITRRGWKILSKNIDLLQKLVLDMLRLSAGGKLKISNCDFNDIVKSIVEMLAVDAEKHHKKLIADTETAVVPVQMDEDGAYQIVLNLVLNALEAVNEGTGKVEVKTRYDRERERIILSVEDNGPGIQDTQAVFEPFYTSKGKSGVGLGLAVTRKIVTRHGGTIEIESSPGNGSTFRVTLPIRVKERE